MQYLLFIAVDPAGEPVTKSPEAWVEEWNSRGVRIEGMPLKPLSEAKTVRVRGDEVLVTDGPFAETAEWIAGYDLIECADLDEAIEVAAGHPMAQEGRIEVRPLDLLDLGPELANRPNEGDAPTSRFLALFRVDPSAPTYEFGDAAVAEWTRAGIASGAYHAGLRLASVETATLVRRRDGELLVTDGPYTEVAEWVTGVAFIDGEWDEALAYLATAPMAHSGLVELREFWTDFGA